jgi:hypothetical protein
MTKEAADRLKTLLADCDPAAADFIETNHAALGPLFPGHAWAAFAQQVQNYAFDEALALLESALKE